MSAAGPPQGANCAPPGGAGAHTSADPAARLRASNRTTALVLASIAVVFFVGIIATKFMGGPMGISVVGAAVLLFLVVAIGRNLRR
jgi:hypothetical protein